MCRETLKLTGQTISRLARHLTTTCPTRAEHNCRSSVRQLHLTMAAPDKKKDDKAADENTETDELQQETELARFSPEEEAVSADAQIIESNTEIYS